MQLGLTEDEIKAIIAETTQQSEKEYQTAIEHITDRLADTLPIEPSRLTLGSEDMKFMINFAATLGSIILSRIENTIIKIILENNRRLAEQYHGEKL